MARLGSLPRILVFAGSIRAGALSQKLADAAAKELALAEADVTKASLADYPLPIYDGDLEAEKGIPENALQFGQLLAAHAGVFIATPEYNNSLPPLLVNAVAWLSRIRESSGIRYRHRVFAIGSTSDGPIGGGRGLPDLRKLIAAGLRGVIVPEKIEVSRAQDAFDEAGALIAEGPSKLLKALARSLVELSARLAD
jgi:NAD(P)H-dependent FMN reductase